MIPARLGSKRVPRKNLRLINGRPLISYNIETAVKSGVFDEVYVNSEAEGFFDIAEENKDLSNKIINQSMFPSLWL